jgi:outer membrane protein, multidrug efflux system
VGLEKNSDIQTARLLTQEAQASLQASRQAFLPSVSLTPEGSLSSFGGAKPSKTYSLGGTAEWEIDAFGGLRNAKKGSLAALEASRAYEQAVQTQLVATIAETYIRRYPSVCTVFYRPVHRLSDEKYSAVSAFVYITHEGMACICIIF